MQKSDPPIIVQQSIDANPEKIWAALTVLSEMHQWYFDNIPDFQPTIGFKTSFATHNEGRTFTHQWEVTETIPNKLITYSWSCKEYPGLSTVTFEILESGEQSIVKLSTNVLEEFPQDIPEFKRESEIGGWNYFIKDRLKNYLESK